MGRPKPFEESIRQFLSNPLGLTAEDLLQEKKVTTPVAIACWCGGLLICWLGGWVKADYKYSALSDKVLSGALLCAMISIGATLVFARTNLKLHWRIASTVFAVSAWGVAGWFFIGAGLDLHH
jgi:nitroreductase